MHTNSDRYIVLSSTNNAMIVTTNELKFWVRVDSDQFSIGGPEQYTFVANSGDEAVLFKVLSEGAMAS